MTAFRPSPPLRGGPRRASERGAAAVEFALLLPLLAAMLFGIIDYGLWFSDSLGVRDSVREAARVAVVKNWGGGEAACSSGGNLERVACVARTRTHPLTGDVYVKVFAKDNLWVKGQPLVVCGMVKADGLVGYVPLPNDRLIKSKTSMSIEAVAVGGETQSPWTDTPPPGTDWSWCS